MHLDRIDILAHCLVFTLYIGYASLCKDGWLHLVDLLAHLFNH